MSFAHMQTLKSLLCGVEGAIADAECRVSACHLALQAAQASYDKAEKERRTLKRSRGSLLRAINEARSMLSSTLSLPSEILSLIFAHATSGRRKPATLEDILYEDSIIDWACATLPRNLRLVCKRWNDVALATPDLWTYIAVPAQSKFIARGKKGLPEYLALQLERSRTLPLSVVVDAEFKYKDGTSGRTRNGAIDLQGDFLRKAFDVLVTEHTVARIRFLDIHGGPPTRPPQSFIGTDQNNIRDLTMGMLHLPTPCLEEVYILMNPDDSEESEPWPTGSISSALPPYFPVAPNLHTLRTVRFPVLCYPPHPGFPSLELLSVVYNCVQESHLLGMLTLCPALRELYASIVDLDEDAQPTVPKPVTLPARLLHIDWAQSSHAVLSEVTLPNVTSLRISPSMLFDGLNLHVSVASTLTSIYFEGSEIVEPDEISYQLLGVLSHIENATFATDLEVARLTQYLCHDEPIWPRLKHLTIRSELTRDDNAELVRLARHRSQKSVDALPRKVEALQTITLQKIEVAHGAVVQMRVALGADNVILLS